MVGVCVWFCVLMFAGMYGWGATVVVWETSFQAAFGVRGGSLNAVNCKPRPSM